MAVTLAVGGGVALGGVPAAASPSTSGRVVLSGTITANGVAVRDASVAVWAWPNAATLTALPPGGIVPLQRIATPVLGVGGRFALDASALSGLGASYRESTGEVSLEVDASSGNQRMAYHQSVTAAGATAKAGFAANPAAGETVVATSRPKTPDLALNFGVAPTAFDTTNDPGGWVTPAGLPLSASARHAETVIAATLDPIPRLRAAAAAQVAAEPPGYCYTTAGAWTYGVKEFYLSVWGWAGAKGTVKQARSVANTLGVGFKAAASGASNDRNLWMVFGGVTREGRTFPGMI